ncbi:glycoside hydrolase family 97 protein [Flavobacterium sp. 120]|uniref:glycoside hydrolase family 97 protein n=1 Tax=Flavobacterium sp. 120 TaxID=2135626 RepID=UPI000EB081DB|nr:glycoside hydrolase family 97 protein [Flavobacterium sp. 120]RKS12854.1 glycosyl hydrolase family 97 [Flavobacterium sp. 120]RKS15923.1 glycosyl hydrolase family 97 [Flavobacterium sp. 120]
MKKIVLLAFLALSLSSFVGKPTGYSFVNSDRTIKIEFSLNLKKTPSYKVFFKDKLVVNTSDLGIVREDANFYTDLKIVAVSKSKPIQSNYSMLQGKRKKIAYAANQYTVSLQNNKGERMNVIFQLSHDGIALRYHFPETSTAIKKITEEKTTYNFDTTTKAWLQPMSKAKTGWKETNPSYEEHYAMGVPVNTKPAIGEGWVYPALFHANDTWVLISETGLQANYCGSRLVYNDTAKAMQVTFPQKEEIFPNGALNPESVLPWYTPWRIITIGSLKTITESTMGTDLADPSTVTDTSFIKSGIASWSWVLLKDESVNYETTHIFIDYAAAMNWPYCLIDADWDTRIGDEKMKELSAYAKGKNVKLLVWYNSSGSWNSTEYHPKSKLITHADRVREFTRLNEMGIAGIKVDFFGGDGQSMIAYYHDMLTDAAAHKLVINLHGATLPRGWQRTYPNLLTTEAVKGYEYITFFQDIADLAPTHCAMLPFARNVFDPMDFTPMVLDSIPNITRKTTPAFELALPVLFLSGIQHMAETPDGMAKMPAYVVDYLKDIPTNWDDSKFIDGYPGKYIIMARKKDNIWHIVGINGETTAKEIEIDLSFVTNSKGFSIAEDENGFQQKAVSKSTKLKVTMKPHGGFVVKI